MAPTNKEMTKMIDLSVSSILYNVKITKGKTILSDSISASNEPTNVAIKTTVQKAHNTTKQNITNATSNLLQKIAYILLSYQSRFNSYGRIGICGKHSLRFGNISWDYLWHTLQSHYWSSSVGLQFFPMSKQVQNGFQTQPYLHGFQI